MRQKKARGEREQTLHRDPRPPATVGRYTRSRPISRICQSIGYCSTGSRRSLEA